MKHRGFDVTVTPLGNGKMLIHSRRSGATKILPTSEAQALLSCRTFATLHDHARACCRERRQAAVQGTTSLRGRLLRWALKMAEENDIDVPLRSQDVDWVERQLSSFVNDGFLVSEADLLEDLRVLCQNGKKETAPSRFTFGIPTCGRPAYLRRCATSFMGNFRRHNRSPALAIIDDSGRADAREANRQVLRKLKAVYDADIFYADRQHRARFARRVARAADIPPEITEFALLGDPRCDRTVGGAYNTFLLHSVGEVAFLSDDDIVCKIAAAPELMQGLTLTSKADANEHWFFKDPTSALETVSFLEKDFFALHEQLLGQEPVRCIASATAAGEELCIEEMSSHFLKSLSSPEARVAVSFTGTVGDSGAKDALYRLFAEGPTFERLVSASSGYETKGITHQILKTARQATISDGVYCMATVMGLDHRTLLPPFMPVQRSSDGVFSALLKRCFPTAYRGLIPYVLVHDSPTHRPPEPDVLACVEPPRVNDILRWFILRFEAPPLTQDAPAYLEQLGHYLAGWGETSRAEFEHFARRTCSEAFLTLISKAKQRLEENRYTPIYWAEDMRKLVSAHEELLLQEDFFVPSDLEGRAAERMTLFQELVHKFGQLLIYWPSLVEAARELKGDQIFVRPTTQIA